MTQSETRRPPSSGGSALMLREGEIDDRGIDPSIMRGWRLRGIARGANIPNFRKQLSNLPLQNVDLAPLSSDRIVQFGNRLFLVRDERLQSIETRKI